MHQALEGTRGRYARRQRTFRAHYFKNLPFLLDTFCLAFLYSTAVLRVLVVVATPSSSYVAS
jgi:hypothetical protein